ncbi:hypothetical protein IJ162_01655 [Candidatus Saccharibacteria bacterium]|nr:hypothetical protein [Candidatus Saccharibacteria bacterium]
MAENLNRSYFEILDELFTGPNAALEKYAKVRITQYEMNLWRKHHLPLKEVDKKAKRYFNVRFLGEGSRIDKASPEALKKAFESLHFAVGKDSGDPSLCSGCHQRCLRLVNELNEALKRDGLDEISDAEKFLDFMTFDYEVRTDENGQPIEEKPYGFLIRTFHDADNRKEFRAMLQMLKTEKREMSMQDIWKIIGFKKKHSKISK